MSNSCLQCGVVITRRKNGHLDTMKFCSKSHAASYNNTRRVSKRLELRPCETCEKCGGRKSDSSKHSICQTCFNAEKQKELRHKTLGELRKDFSLNAYHAKIRGWSRQAYKGDRVCFICGYNRHVDICHIKPVSSFNLDTVIGVVNHPDNLVALCKNHHWEFDRGLIGL